MRAHIVSVATGQRTLFRIQWPAACVPHLNFKGLLLHSGLLYDAPCAQWPKTGVDGRGCAVRGQAGGRHWGPRM